MAEESHTPEPVGGENGEDEPDWPWPWDSKTFHQRVQDPGITSYSLLQMITTTGEDANAIDPDGGNYAPIHFIVTGKHKSSRKAELLIALMIGNADVDLTTTRKGMTALHLAVKADDIEAMRTLVALGADVNKPDLLGKTPLDTARLIARDKLPSPESEVQLDNFPFRRTKLLQGHEARDSGFERTIELSSSVVQEMTDSPSDSEMVRELESVGALPGAIYCKTSRSPSPGAVYCKTSRSPSPNPQRAGSQEEAASSNGSPREESCALYYKQLEDSVMTKLQDSEYTPSPEEAVQLVKRLQESLIYRRKCGSRILCLDGGGIKGLLQLEILRQIEVKTGKRITELFDWIVGTSTGGVIALALVYGKKSVRNLQHIYWRVREDVFGKGEGFLGKGSSENLQVVLKDWLGEDITMDKVKHPKVLIPAVNKKRTRLELHFFNNCFDNEYSSELVWKVARYTSAAPFYFTEQDNYIDGGILANNPCEDALTAIQEFYHQREEKLPISLLVSIGVGSGPSRELGPIDVQKSFEFNRIIKFDTWRTWMDFLKVMGSAVLNHTATKNCDSRCREQGIKFFRFSPKLDHSVRSDETNFQPLLNMLWKNRVYLNEKQGQLDSLAELFQQSELYTPV